MAPRGKAPPRPRARYAGLRSWCLVGWYRQPRRPAFVDRRVTRPQILAVHQKRDQALVPLFRIAVPASPAAACTPAGSSLWPAPGHARAPALGGLAKAHPPLAPCASCPLRRCRRRQADGSGPGSEALGAFAAFRPLVVELRRVSAGHPRALPTCRRPSPSTWPASAARSRGPSPSPARGGPGNRTLMQLDRGGAF